MEFTEAGVHVEIHRVRKFGQVETSGNFTS